MRRGLTVRIKMSSEKGVLCRRVYEKSPFLTNISLSLSSNDARYDNNHKLHFNRRHSLGINCYSARIYRSCSFVIKKKFSSNSWHRCIHRNKWRNKRGRPNTKFQGRSGGQTIGYWPGWKCCGMIWNERDSSPAQNYHRHCVPKMRLA